MRRLKVCVCVLFIQVGSTFAVEPSLSVFEWFKTWFPSLFSGAASQEAVPARKFPLENYYESRFFEKSGIDTAGRDAFYQLANRAGRIDLGNKVQLVIKQKMIKDKQVEFATYQPSDLCFDEQPAIIYFGGTREDAADIESNLSALSKKLKQTIIQPNYPGYGKSEGKAGFDNNIRAMKDFVSDYLMNHPEKRVSIIGYSYGTSIAVEIAKAFPQIDHLALVGGFSSVKQEGWDYAKWYEKPLIPLAIHKNKANTANNLKVMPARASGDKLTILSFHGEADKTVPYKHQQVLNQAAEANPFIRFLKTGSYRAGHLDAKEKALGLLLAFNKSYR